MDSQTRLSLVKKSALNWFTVRTFRTDLPFVEMRIRHPLSIMEVTRWIIRTSLALSSDRGRRLRRLPLTQSTARVTLRRLFIRTSKPEADHRVQHGVVLPIAMESSWPLMDNAVQLVRPLRHYIPIPFPTAVRRLRLNGRTSRLLRCTTESPTLNNTLDI